jgi:outer membrane lipoprotein carrier protein
MTKVLYLVTICLFAGSVFAQKAAPAEKNDPEAKKLLDKVRKKYDGYKTLEAGFSLIIELPGQPKETQKGTIAQDGDKFKLVMNDQSIISDGKSTWVYLKKNNEVQINNTDKADANGFLTPKELLNRYQKGDFLYAITEKVTEGGKVLTQVEFKPKDKNSEYSKLRVSIDAKNNTIESIKAFAKDGSRYSFNITKLTPNKKFAATEFTFDKTKYPHVKVEDLRM